MINADEAVGAWALDIWSRGDGRAIHEAEYGCKVSGSNVRFGKASMGQCETCYWEYPALFFDIDCTCLKQVPGTKNPDKLRPNLNRFKIKAADIHFEGSLSDVYAEIAAIQARGQAIAP